MHPALRFAAAVRNAGASLSPAARDVLLALGLALSGVAVTFFVHLLFPAFRQRYFDLPFDPPALAEVFAAWDSRWYFNVARYGYWFNPNAQSNVAFFPLYPLLMRAAAWPLGGSDRAVWTAGILVSWGAFAAALFALHRFTERYTGAPEIARRTTLYVALFPFSFYFGKVYTESLFLLLSVLAVTAGWDGRWTKAGVWGALAALTRPNGILVALPLACFALAGRPSARECVRRIPAVALPFAGLALYCAYLFWLTGDAVAWLSTQRHWSYGLGHAPWARLLDLLGDIGHHGLYGYLFTSPTAPIDVFQGATVLTFLLLTPHVFTGLGVPFGAYVLASLLVPLSSGELEGLGRYCAVLFPVFILAGSLRSRRAHEGIVIVSAMLLVLFAGLFVNLHPIY